MTCVLNAVIYIRFRQIVSEVCLIADLFSVNSPGMGHAAALVHYGIELQGREFLAGDYCGITHRKVHLKNIRDNHRVSLFFGPRTIEHDIFHDVSTRNIESVGEIVRRSGQNAVNVPALGQTVSAHGLRLDGHLFADFCRDDLVAGDEIHLRSLETERLRLLECALPQAQGCGGECRNYDIRSFHIDCFLRSCHL